MVWISVNSLRFGVDAKFLQADRAKAVTTSPEPFAHRGWWKHAKRRLQNVPLESFRNHQRVTPNQQTIRSQAGQRADRPIGFPNWQPQGQTTKATGPIVTGGGGGLVGFPPGPQSLSDFGGGGVGFLLAIG